MHLDRQRGTHSPSSSGTQQRQNFEFSVAVGRLRARYLPTAIQMTAAISGEPPKDDYFDDLKHKREIFEESRAPLDALWDAIQKAYIDVEWL